MSTKKISPGCQNVVQLPRKSCEVKLHIILLGSIEATKSLDICVVYQGHP